MTIYGWESGGAKKQMAISRLISEVTVENSTSRAGDSGIDLSCRTVHDPNPSSTLTNFHIIGNTFQGGRMAIRGNCGDVRLSQFLHQAHSINPQCQSLLRITSLSAERVPWPNAERWDPVLTRPGSGSTARTT